MTLVMTELRDDVPAGPDPTFNPNLFSEDEEEVFQEPQLGTPRCSSEAQSPPIAPMTPRNSRLNTNRPKSQISNQFITSEALSPALARAESYEDEFSYVELQDMVSFCENLRATSGNTYRTPPRHNSPRCCDVPTLQSPKNAVAPTQTLIATSNPNTDYTGNIQRVKTALADQQTNMATKKDIENNKMNQISDEKTSLNSNSNSANIIPLSIQSGQITGGGNLGSGSCSPSTIIKGLNGSGNCSQSQSVFFNGLNSIGSSSGVLSASNLQSSNIQTTQISLHSKNSLNSGGNLSPLTGLGCSSAPQPSVTPTCSKPTNLKSVSNANGVCNGPISPPCSSQTSQSNNTSQQNSKRKELKSQGCCGKSSPSSNQVGIAPGKSEELRYIDEENCLEGTTQFRSVHRTPTVVSIGPLCLADPIVRSCSVGYLDLVDAQLVPCEVALRMLRKEAPNKRLVLVSRKTRKRRKNKPQSDVVQTNTKPPRLKNCGKSRSLDSSDIFPSTEQIATAPQLPEHVEEISNAELQESRVVQKDPEPGDNEQKKSSDKEAAEILEDRQQVVLEKPTRLEASPSPAR